MWEISRGVNSYFNRPRIAAGSVPVDTGRLTKRRPKA
jgi:hypothetical protein